VKAAVGDLVRCRRVTASSAEAWHRGERNVEEWQGIVREVREGIPDLADGVFVQEAPTYAGSVGDQHWTRTQSSHVAFDDVLAVLPSPSQNEAPR
jgi:hypothetical protein